MGLLVIGGLVSLAGGIWLIVVAFQESVLWGLGSLIVPLVVLVFTAMHWDEARTPFLVSLGGTVLMIAGVAILGAAGGPVG